MIEIATPTNSTFPSLPIRGGVNINTTIMRLGGSFIGAHTLESLGIGTHGQPSEGKTDEIKIEPIRKPAPISNAGVTK